MRQQKNMSSALMNSVEKLEVTLIKGYVTDCGPCSWVRREAPAVLRTVPDLLGLPFNEYSASGATVCAAVSSAGAAGSSSHHNQQALCT